MARRKPMVSIQARIEAEKYEELLQKCRNGDNLSDLLRDAVDLLLAGGKKKLSPKGTKRNVGAEAEAPAKIGGRIKCGGKYKKDGVERQCRLSEGGYCIRAVKPLNCPKLSREELDELRGRNKAIKLEEKQE